MSAPHSSRHPRDDATDVPMGLHASFYLPHAHPSVAAAVRHSLEAYQRAVGPRALTSYADEDGEWQPLDAQGWEKVHRELTDAPWANVHLSGDSLEAPFRFDYLGREHVDASFENGLGEVSAVSFWFSTRYVEQQGPQQVRDLLLALAEPLPFASGNAGLAFSGSIDVAATLRHVRRACIRCPGLDVLRPSLTALRIGTRVRGPSWLTFLGAPVLSKLGGTAALRSRLGAPDSTIQAMDEERAVVTLGARPEASDGERGEELSGYRELARILEPWMLWGEGESVLGLDPEAARRWERRFLD
ncbi:type VI immunity family protein [Myxococcus sp. 1LA]